MNGHGYIVAPTPMKPPPLGSQEVNYRWPHVGTGNEREGTMSAHLLEKNYTPRMEGKYTAVRSPCDMRTRYDAGTLVHDEQQRLHALYMEQFYRGNANEVRSAQVSTEMRFNGYDSRQPLNKKNMDETQSPEIQKTIMDQQYYSQDTKIGYADGDGRYLQNGYSTSAMTNGKLTHNDVKRYDMPENNGKDSSTMGTPPTNSSIQQKANDSINNGASIFSDDMNGVTNVKIEENSSLTKKEEPFDQFLSVDIDPDEKIPESVKEKENTENSQKSEVTERNTKIETEETSNSDKSSTEKFTTDEVTDNGLPSYTAMIAQAILKKSSKSTLSDIYEYMEKNFPSLEKRGTGWRNCVRHTLSLNDCFLKLHRPENGRSCNWTIHPSYYDSFARGDYRKKRALRKRARGLQWMDPINFNGYPLMREYDIHSEVNQQQHPLFHHPPPAGIWVPPQNGYNCSFVQTSPDHLHHLPPSHPSPSHASPSANVHSPSPYSGTHLNHSGHYESANCTNADCYCQYNRNNCRVYSM